MAQKIAIIGGGNLGASIAEGLLESGFIRAEDLIITRRNTKALNAFVEKGIQVVSDNKQALAFADFILFAVKPFQIKEILTDLLPYLDAAKHTIGSVITGIWVKDIVEVIGNNFTIFRIMPNTAIAIRQSMTCLCGHNASGDQLDYVTQMFDQLGKTVVIEEKLMDAATVLGACGTAYALRFIRANIQGGIEIGFSAAVASLIAEQTAKGAADLLLQKNTHPEQEIDKVTTPKGCTIAGLNEMEHQGFSSSVIQGIKVSYEKIVGDK
ncbi:pyrroline-5-carboxylate reductase [Rhizosphaericola mali]|uniref:Pyrroline-5-carboxylate reductase n=1 Tax=Rhizosphaericola mali TaxID=2545455 RepID=A0A5P2G443_9BACT|nr:pyrroline-5-carboxylate reductase [Rhizosphaericola mali]QES90606.1 pyrroline-5-carboxylate reductase [Rhizosphaericola mali]